MLLVVVALAAVIVLAVGALGTGIIKLPSGPAGPTGPTSSGLVLGSPGQSAGPVEAPPPIDHLVTAVTGALTLGNSSPVQEIQLGSDGSSTSVSAPGMPWDGLKIDVPAGSWPGATLQITAQPIMGSSFGDLVTPISPLYTVSGAEGMAPMPVTLKIPATVPDDSFAMGFFYDPSGRLEAMPLLAEDGTSVTVATRHFSAGFVSLIKLALLPPTADSGFRPGKDDWEFPNEGSYVAKDGHCSGQVLTEAWYYIERHQAAEAKQLYGRYDNNGGEPTPSMWEDDSRGYRLASVAQTQIDWDAKAVTFFRSWRGTRFDNLQYHAFLYALNVTGEPQLMSLSDAQGGSGHTILAYRVTPASVFVADPNYPRARRWVPFDATSGMFGTYRSGLSAKGYAVTYTNFVNEAKTALLDWSVLAADWAAFDAGTIGSGVFPDTQVLVYEEEARLWDPLTDGYQTDQPIIQVRVVGPASATFTGAIAKRGTTTIGNGGGNQEQEQGSFAITLNPGDNDIGFVISFSQQNWVHMEGDPAREVRDWGYVDFVRLRVTLVAASPSPAASTAQPLGVAVRMDIAGSFVRNTHLADLKIQPTGSRTFGKHPSETRIKDLAGEIAADGQSVTLTITYLDDPNGPSLASCPNVTILRNIPLGSTDPTTRTHTFWVSGWDAIMATIQDSYPYYGPTLPRAALCATTADWSFNQDANPNPAVYITLGY